MERIVLSLFVLLASLSLLVACDGGSTANAKDGTQATAPKAQAPEGSGAVAPSAPVGEPATAPSAPAPGASNSPAFVAASAKVPVYRVIDNRYLLHTLDAGGIVLSAGSPGFIKYVQGTWKSPWTLGKSLDGGPVAFTDGISGKVRFPLDKSACKDGCTLAFELKGLAKGQRVSVFVNKHEHTAIDVSEDWQTLTVDVPASELGEGDVMVRFHFRKTTTVEGVKTAAAFKWIHMYPKASTAPTGLVADPPLVTKVKGPKGEETALDAGAFDGYSFYAMAPEAGAFRVGATGTCEGGAAPGDACHFEVEVLDAETAKVAVEGSIVDFQGGKAVELPLDGLGGKVVRITMKSVGIAKGGWLEPAIVAPAPKKSMTVDRSKISHVMFWLADTLRWDKLKAYNPKTVVKTPNMDAIIAKGVRFDVAYTQGGHSIPGHSTLVTGTYPDVHKHLHPKSKLKPEHLLISEALKDAKIDSGLFTSNGYVSDKWGFKQGWSAYKNPMREGKLGATNILWPYVDKWMTKKGAAKWFIYLATVDPHVAYRWKDEFTPQYFDTKGYKGPVKKVVTGGFLNKIKEGKVTMKDQDKAKMEAIYDGEVSFNDKHFGIMLKKLEELGIADSTVIIITSDHGDEFWEHGSVGHGHTLYDELIRIPLVFYHPTALPQGEVITTGVELIDIFPTVMDMFGLDNPDTVQGESLLTLMEEGDGGQMQHPIFADHGKSAKAVRIGKWKYILKSGDNEELFDVSSDTYEQKDVKAKKPHVRRYVRDVMAFWLTYDEVWKKPVMGYASNHLPGFAKVAHAYGK